MEVTTTPAAIGDGPRITARAVVAYDAESGPSGPRRRRLRTVVAYVAGADAVAQLRSRWRVVGIAAEERPSSVGKEDVAEDGAGDDSPMLRLVIEEVAVGVANGFLRLEMETQDEAQQVEHALQRIVQDPTADTGPQFTMESVAMLRLRVFADLWERGHYVAFGSKFGADFLLYEADPTSCHSFAMVVVKDYDAAFATLDIVAHCRVAKMVKKEFVLASQHNGQIVYLSIDHAVLAAMKPERR